MPCGKGQPRLGPAGTASTGSETDESRDVDPAAAVSGSGRRGEGFPISAFPESRRSWKRPSLKHPELPPAQILMAQLFAQANLPVLVRTALEKAVVKCRTIRKPM